MTEVPFCQVALSLHGAEKNKKNIALSGENFKTKYQCFFFEHYFHQFTVLFTSISHGCILRKFQKAVVKDIILFLDQVMWLVILLCFLLQRKVAEEYVGYALIPQSGLKEKKNISRENHFFKILSYESAHDER